MINFTKKEAVRLWDLLADSRGEGSNTLNVLGVPLQLQVFPYNDPNSGTFGEPDQCKKVADFLEDMSKLLRG